MVRRASLPSGGMAGTEAVAFPSTFCACVFVALFVVVVKIDWRRLSTPAAFSLSLSLSLSFTPAPLFLLTVAEEEVFSEL